MITDHDNGNKMDREEPEVVKEQKVEWWFMLKSVLKFLNLND